MAWAVADGRDFLQHVLAIAACCGSHDPLKGEEKTVESMAYTEGLPVALVDDSNC